MTSPPSPERFAAWVPFTAVELEDQLDGDEIVSALHQLLTEPRVALDPPEEPTPSTTAVSIHDDELAALLAYGRCGECGHLNAMHNYTRHGDDDGLICDVCKHVIQ